MRRASRRENVVFRSDRACQDALGQRRDGMRKAKIICTLGPASDSPQVLAELLRAGMDVARLNFSHGTREEHRGRLERVRALSKRLDRRVAILQDIQGPKLRLGQFEGGQLTLREGQEVVL